MSARLPDFNLLESIKNDYCWATITTAWYEENNEPVLVLAFVELFPAEFPRPDDIPVANSTTSKKKWTILRRNVSVVDGLRWYTNALNGEVDLGFKKCVNKKFTQEPNWPVLTLLTQGLPFLSRWHASPRVHHLIGADTFQSKLPLTPAQSRFLSEWLFFDLAEYPELFGSVHLIAPNPLLRSFGGRLLETTDGQEKVVFHAVPRSGADLSTLTLHHFQRRPTGLAFLESFPFLEPVIETKECNAVVETAHAVVCSQRGLLLYSPPAGFLKQVSITSNIITAQKKVGVPPVKRKPGYEYVAPHSVTKVPTQVGDSARPAAWQVLDAGRRMRNRIRKAETRYILDDPLDAAKVIRKILGRAQNEILIYDPYFESRDLFEFVAVLPQNINKQILVVESCLKRGDPSTKSELSVGLSLQKQLDGNNFGPIEIRYVSHLTRPIHDRFIKVDDKLWHSGNSLNTLGTELSVLSMMTNARAVIERLEAAWTKAAPITKWTHPNQSTEAGEI